MAVLLELLQHPAGRVTASLRDAGTGAGDGGASSLSLGHRGSRDVAGKWQGSRREAGGKLEITFSSGGHLSRPPSARIVEPGNIHGYVEISFSFQSQILTGIPLDDEENEDSELNCLDEDLALQ